MRNVKIVFVDPKSLVSKLYKSTCFGAEWLKEEVGRQLERIRAFFLELTSCVRNIM